MRCLTAVYNNNTIFTNEHEFQVQDTMCVKYNIIVVTTIYCDTIIYNINTARRLRAIFLPVDRSPRHEHV